MTLELVQQQLKAGVDAHLHGNLLGAESAYQAVLQLDSNNATAHNNLGFVYGQQSRWDEALQHLQTALDIQPDYATACSNMGQIYFSIGEKEKGLQLLEKAVVLNDGDAQNWHNLARICLLSGNFQRAEYAWWRAQHLKPTQLDYAVNLGVAIAAQQRLSEAEKIYQSVLQANSAHFNALLQLGICWLMMKNYGNAQAILTAAYRINPSDAMLLRHLSLVELCLGDKKAAAAALQQLVEKHPVDEESQIDYALVLLDLKEYSLVRERYNVICQWQNPSERSQHYLQVIEKALESAAVH